MTTLARTILAAAAGAALLGCASGTAQRAGAPVEVPAYSAETFYDTVSIGGARFSPDGERLIYASDESGVFNIYRLDLTEPDAAPVRVTRSTTDAIFPIGYLPDGESILYTADQGGNELNHVYLRDPAGNVRDLTPGENLKASFAGWHENDEAFWVTTNERDPNYFDLYEYDVAGYDRERVFEGSDEYTVATVSPNGRYVALTRTHSNADDDVYLYDRWFPDEEPKHVTPHEGDVSHNVQDFTPDSRALLLTSNEGSDFQRLWSHNVKTGKDELVFEDEWDVSGAGFSRDGRYRVISVNEDASTVLHVTRTGSGDPVDLPEFTGASVVGATFAETGDKAVLAVNGDTSPTNLHLHDMDTGRTQRLTQTLSPKIDEDHLVESEVVRYPSFDGLEIPALLYKPRNASAQNPAPAVVWVHGGPGGQTRTGYSAVLQFLVNHGYAVLGVNNRGSSGYGTEFFHMDDKRHGDVDLKDCVWGRKYLESLDWVDGDSVAIMGGSYGGYMVCAALAFEPDAFDAGIDIFGVTNWVRTLESIPPWWAAFRDSLYAELGDPAEEEERLRAISPLFHAENITKPLLVIQGANDPRVLKVESDEMVEAVRDNGVPVEYIVFDDEGHGFRSKQNRVTAAEAYLDFLDTHLRDN